jgi:hypothetical protein
MSWVDCFTTSAEKGAPGMERRLVPADKVPVAAGFVFPPTWLNDAEALNRRMQQITTQAALMISPEGWRHCTRNFFAAKNKNQFAC